MSFGKLDDAPHKNRPPTDREKLKSQVVKTLHMAKDYMREHGNGHNDREARLIAHLRAALDTISEYR